MDKRWRIVGVLAKDLVNPIKWWWFIQAKLRKLFVSHAYCEQVVYASIVCRECVTKGKCIDCGCKMPEKAMVKGARCSLGKWENRNDKDWEVYKAKNGIDFEIIYK